MSKTQSNTLAISAFETMLERIVEILSPVVIPLLIAEILVGFVILAEILAR